MVDGLHVWQTPRWKEIQTFKHLGRFQPRRLGDRNRLLLADSKAYQDFVADHRTKRQNQKMRCDNEPKYINHALQNWAKKQENTLEYIQPGNPQRPSKATIPQQNAYIEHYNRTVRYDWLNRDLFTASMKSENATKSQISK